MRRRIALLGNPNVGKSTIFNALTGMHQHTGNWAGVTVGCACGSFQTAGQSFSIVDLPGIYSFDVRSEEEALTRRYISSEDYEVLLLVCDATCLERGLHLLKQAAALIAERSGQKRPQIMLCINLCDEAEKKGIQIDCGLLERRLAIPVVPCCACDRDGLRRLKLALTAPSMAGLPMASPCAACPHCAAHPAGSPCNGCEALSAQNCLTGFSPQDVAACAVSCSKTNWRRKEEILDRILTGPVTGTCLMLLLLMGIFWLTIAGANVPSSLLWELFARLETILLELAVSANAPAWFIGAAIHGIYRVVTWIISVMLPPMAIFFPLFTLFENLGYLPRVAFNMDGAFQKCRSCGKQCLTMAMGLGCNAAGVTGCRIIDSPRERLIAILTNSLVPCNGKFPLIITMIALFAPSAPLQVLALTGLILLGIAATLGASWLLSHTLLKGVPSSFILELPPYRRPQVGKILVRSVFDRTLFVLGRAVFVAVPAGLVIWVLANVTVGGQSLLLWLSGVLEPLGRLMGLDGIILMAFILGFPANEIVLPIILMAYLQTGYLVEMEDTGALASLLFSHGWTIQTVVCMAIFSLFHWPCSTTCLTIKKETGSLKWTAVAFLLPTITGVLLCILISAIFPLLLRLLTGL